MLPSHLGLQRGERAPQGPRTSRRGHQPEPPARRKNARARPRAPVVMGTGAPVSPATSSPGRGRGRRPSAPIRRRGAQGLESRAPPGARDGLSDRSGGRGRRGRLRWSRSFVNTSRGRGAARVTHHGRGPWRPSCWRAALPGCPVRLSHLGSARSRLQELSHPAPEGSGGACGAAPSTGGRRGCASAPRSGGRPGSPLEGSFRGAEEEEEMLLPLCRCSGSCSGSFGPRPQPLGGEEVVALGAHGGCRRPAPSPRPGRAPQ